MINMKNDVLHSKWIAWLILLAFMLFYSCSMETETAIVVDEGETEVKLNLEFTVDGRATRAMTHLQEQKVNEVHVLIFKQNTKKLVDVRKAQWITESSDKKTKTFILPLPKGVFDLMVLANSGGVIQEADLQPDMSKDEVIEKLTLRQAGRWNADSTHPDLIPFWGERTNYEIKEDNSYIDGISMLRALSRIDIAVVGEAKTVFKLETVRLYHWQQEMCLIPASYDAEEEAVTNATVSGSGLMPVTTFMDYSEADITTSGEAIESVIYVNETPNPGISSFPVLPCLVVGGKVNGQRRYYRIDFNLKEQGIDNYYDLLRNHRYRIEITKVITNGSDDESMAYESVPVGLEWQVHIWEEGNMDNIIVQGNQWLRVEPGKFIFPMNEHQESDQNVTTQASGYTNYIFQVETNVLGGWKIKDLRITYSEGDIGWLDFSVGKGESGTISEVELFVYKNNTNRSRYASFIIVAGDIEYKVSVEQTAAELAFISITEAPGNNIQTKEFESSAGQSQTFVFVVEWFPGDWNCTVEIEDISGYNPLNIQSLNTSEIREGCKVYELSLEPFDSSKIGQTLASEFVFTVGECTGRLKVENRGIP